MHHRHLVVEQLESRRLLSTTILSEGFEGFFPPSDGSWTVNTSQSRVWDDTNYKAHGGSWSAHCAEKTDGTSTNTYVNNLDTYMQRTLDLSGYSSVTLAFWYWMNSEANYDFLRVKVNGTELWKQSGSHTSWASQSLDLSAYAGQSNVTLKFEFTSDSSTIPSGDAGAWIDDIAVTGEASAPQPDLLSVTGIPSVVGVGESFTVTVTAENDGGASQEGAIHAALQHSAGNSSVQVGPLTGVEWAVQPPKHFAPGEGAGQIYNRGQTQPRPEAARDWLLEAWENSWTNAERHSMSFTVTPQALGTLKILVRTTVCFR